jgi:hypothetical protein
MSLSSDAPDPGSKGASADSAQDRKIRTLVPRLRSLWILMWPPDCFTKPWTMLRPRLVPAPAGLVVKKGSKARLRNLVRHAHPRVSYRSFSHSSRRLSPERGRIVTRNCCKIDAEFTLALGLTWQTRRPAFSLSAAAAREWTDDGDGPRLCRRDMLIAADGDGTRQ